jgi:hypothetical protein
MASKVRLIFADWNVYSRKNLCDKQFSGDQWFYPGNPVPSTNKNDCYGMI